MQLNSEGKRLLARQLSPKLPLNEAEQVVFNLLTYEINNNMFSALVSFLSSVGEPAFRRSKVLSLVNIGTERSLLAAGEYLRTSHTMRRGKTVGKLVDLRKDESELFLTPAIVESEVESDIAAQ